MTSTATGGEWERLASKLLRRQGFKILSRNFRCRLGEIDIIAESAEVLVFIEVRYRADGRFGGAAASVTRRKQQRIIRAASVYLTTNPSLANRTMRFDVIAFERGDTENGEPSTEWIQSAFDAGRW